MAQRRKTTKKTTSPAPEAVEVKELAHELVEKAKEKDMIKPVEEAEVYEAPIKEEKPKKVTTKQEKPVENKQKFNIGDIVFISKEAGADLNGFKIFPQYKKYTYTVEAYDGNTGVYTLRKLNLSLKLKEELILAPNERAHDTINRLQF